MQDTLFHEIGTNSIKINTKTDNYIKSQLAEKEKVHKKYLWFYIFGVALITLNKIWETIRKEKWKQEVKDYIHRNSNI